MYCHSLRRTQSNSVKDWLLVNWAHPPSGEWEEPFSSRRPDMKAASQTHACATWKSPDGTDGRLSRPAIAAPTCTTAIAPSCPASGIRPLVDTYRSPPSKEAAGNIRDQARINIKPHRHVSSPHGGGPARPVAHRTNSVATAAPTSRSVLTSAPCMTAEPLDCLRAFAAYAPTTTHTASGTAKNSAASVKGIIELLPSSRSHRCVVSWSPCASASAVRSASRVQRLVERYAPALNRAR